MRREICPDGPGFLFTDFWKGGYTEFLSCRWKDFVFLCKAGYSGAGPEYNLSFLWERKFCKLVWIFQNAEKETDIREYHDLYFREDSLLL